MASFNAELARRMAHVRASRKDETQFENAIQLFIDTAVKAVREISGNQRFIVGLAKEQNKQIQGLDKAIDDLIALMAEQKDKRDPWEGAR